MHEMSIFICYTQWPLFSGLYVLAVTFELAFFLGRTCGYGPQFRTRKANQGLLNGKNKERYITAVMN